MLVKQGRVRSAQVDRRLGWTLAAIAGALNTAAFHAVGFFAANMTGNVSLASDNAAAGAWASALFFLAILLLFVFGAAVATLLTSAGMRRDVVGIYALGVLLESVLLTVVWLLCLRLPVATASVVLVLAVSFLMGLQNALVTRISNARVRTTHVSGMSTDIGIELAILADMRRGVEPAARAPLFFSRLKLHSQTLAAFLLGGVAGVLLYERIGVHLLLLAAALLFVMAARQLWRVRRLPAAADVP